MSYLLILVLVISREIHTLMGTEINRPHGWIVTKNLA